MKKLIVMILAVIMLFSVTGCTTSLTPDGPSNNVAGDDKTTIKVAAMAAGLGSTWLKACANDFALAYSEHSFAEGKKGVYVELTQPTSGISGYFANLKNSGQNIVFTEQGSNLVNLIDAGECYDITEVVKNTDRVGGTLEDAMFDKHKEVFKKDGKYYALPHSEFYGGLSYNRDVFVEHEAFIADATCNPDYVTEYSGTYGDDNNPLLFVGGDNLAQEDCVLSAGPDGKPGTTDDGMPRSLEEFVVLLDYFKNAKNTDPIVLSGKYTNMVNYFVAGMWASLAGQAQMESYYSLNGEIDVITGWTNENLIKGCSYIKKPIVEKKTITPANAYLATQMASKYYALAIAEFIQKEGFYSQSGLVSSVTHHDAQSILINSSSATVRGNLGTQQTAMLMDGTYWMNETIDADNFGKYKRYGSKNDKYPDIQYMSLPTSLTNAEREVEGYQPHASTIMDISYGCCVVNANIAGNKEIEDAVKAFLNFFYSEAQLKNYSRTARQFIAVSYSFSDDELKELEPFYQSLWKARDNVNASNVVYPSPRVGSSAETMSVYKRAIGDFYTQLQSPNLKVSDPETTSCYGAYNYTKNAIGNDGVGDGVYVYGSRHVFIDQSIDQQGWHSIYNIGI